MGRQSKGALVAKVSKALARARATVAIRWGKETCRMRWNRDQFLPFEGGTRSQRCASRCFNKACTRNGIPSPAGNNQNEN